MHYREKEDRRCADAEAVDGRRLAIGHDEVIEVARLWLLIGFPHATIGRIAKVKLDYTPNARCHF